jgi:hypothetical protein
VLEHDARPLCFIKLTPSNLTKGTLHPGHSRITDLAGGFGEQVYLGTAESGEKTRLTHRFFDKMFIFQFRILDILTGPSSVGL